MAAPAAAISCRKRLLSPRPLRLMPSASTARYSRRSPTPRPISNCSGRCHLRLPARETTGRAYALRLRPNQDFAGALEQFCREQRHCQRQNPRRRRQHHRRALCGWPHRRAVRHRAGDQRGRHRSRGRWRARSRAGHCAGRLHRRPRRGPADARRQSGADDDGTGAGGGGGRPARSPVRGRASRRCASLPTKISKTTPCTDRLGVRWVLS